MTTMKLSELIENEINASWLDHETLDIPSVVEAITARLHECVKPLEWVDRRNVNRLREEADTELGRYYIVQWLFPDTQFVVNTPRCKQFTTDTLEAAKAAAQEHYAAQIIAGLDL